MNVEYVDVDSLLFGRPVLQVSTPESSAELAAAEQAWLAQHRPGYVGCKVPLENTAAIHLLEAAGFRFIECQIRSEVSIRHPRPVEGLPYEFLRVTSEAELGPVLAIADRTFVHDRFRNDPDVPEGIAERRYREYVRRSFQAPDEAVYRLTERATGATVAFKTHRYVSPTRALLLLGGVDPECKGAGLGAINSYFEHNELLRKGVRRATTHISGSNYPIFVLEIARLGFRVTAAFAVLRKMYR